MARRVLKQKIPPQRPGLCERVALVETGSLRGRGAFCWRYRLDDEALKASIRSAGVLVPVVIQPCKNGPRVLAGHKRLAAARALKLKTVPVLMLDRRLTGKEAFLFSLVSNWKQEFSDMDRAKAVGKAVREFRFRPREVRDTVLPLLGLPSGQGTLDLYLQADSMPPALKDLFEAKKIPFKACGTLLRFSRADQDHFARVTGSKMKLTASQFLQAADWLADIMKRDKKVLKAILRQNPVREILAHRKMDPRTRADRFFDAVKRVRYPEYAAALEGFEKCRDKILHGSEGLRIDPAAGFEDKGIDLHARLKTPRDLDRVLQKLSESRSALNSLFDFML